MSEKPLIWLGRDGRDRCSMKKVKFTRSSGNVFRDLGFSADEAAHLKLRSELMVNLQKAITARRLKQAEAAELLGVTQPRVSDLMRGRVDLFSVETLIDMLARLGIRARLVLQPRRRRVGVA
ncbi:MAG: helix-turn-helix domain-containing protein [Candidatus Rokuibacteriota bacterium]